MVVWTDGRTDGRTDEALSFFCSYGGQQQQQQQDTDRRVYLLPTTAAVFLAAFALPRFGGLGKKKRAFSQLRYIPTPVKKKKEIEMHMLAKQVLLLTTN